MTPIARSARDEARALLGPGYAPRILEPSAPAIDAAPWFADDPVTDNPGAGVVVSPFGSSEGETWDGLAAADPRIARFARERWLGAWGPLAPLPSGFASGRDDLHRLAYGVVAEARRQINGKFGLRATYGGFGTPFFGADEQVRVDGVRLVRQRGDNVAVATISTLSAAARFVEAEVSTVAAEHDSPALGDLDRPLAISAAVVSCLADWWALGTSVLEEVRAGDPDERVQLWPGHFDVALSHGEDSARATLGFSPGDAAHPEPYVYIGPWGSIDRSDPYWNDGAFAGASLPYDVLLADPNPRDRALAWIREGLERLSAA